MKGLTPLPADGWQWARHLIGIASILVVSVSLPVFARHVLGLSLDRGDSRVGSSSSRSDFFPHLNSQACDGAQVIPWCSEETARFVSRCWSFGQHSGVEIVEPSGGTIDVMSYATGCWAQSTGFQFCGESPCLMAEGFPFEVFSYYPKPHSPTSAWVHVVYQDLLGECPSEHPDRASSPPPLGPSVIVETDPLEWYWVDLDQELRCN
jgi:hypothetical protein